MAQLVVLDSRPTPDAAPALAHLTGRPEEEWRALLAAPGLARALAVISSAIEGENLAARARTSGVHATVVDPGPAGAAVAAAFEAAFIERLRDGLVLIRADGEDLELVGPDIRSLTTGVQVVNGAAQRFVVLGLRAAPGAVVLRFPGTESSKLAPDAVGDDAERAVVAAIRAIAPHASVERVEGARPTLAALAGSEDLAMAAVLGAWLQRAVPATDAPSPSPSPSPRAVSPHASPFHGDDDDAVAVAAAAAAAAAARARQAAPPSEEERLARQRDVEASIAALERKARGDAPAPPRERAERKPIDRRIFVAAGAAVLVAGLLGRLFSRPPAEATATLALGTPWHSPWGPSFTFASTYDASIGGIGNVGYVIEVVEGDAREQARIPAHEAKSPRRTLGIRWRILEADGAGRQLKVHVAPEP